MWVCCPITSTSPSHGTLAYVSLSTPLGVGSPYLEYVPDPGYLGPDQFTLRYGPPGCLTAAPNDAFYKLGPPANVSILVSAGSNDPVPENQTIVLNEGQGPVSFTLSSTDPNKDALSYAVNLLPADGLITGTAPNLQYTPPANSGGIETLSFYVIDESTNIESATGVVTFDVDSMFAASQTVTVAQGADTPFALTTGDLLPGFNVVSFQITSYPKHGLVDSPPTESLSSQPMVYDPFGNYTGTDSLTYTASDGVRTSQGTITFDVLGRPSASSQTLGVVPGGQVSFQFTGSDPNGLTLSFTEIGQPQYGTLGALNGSTSAYQYTRTANFAGVETLAFLVSDGKVSGNIVTVTIGVYLAPVVTPPSSTPTYCVIGVPSTLPVQATDPDNLPLTLQIVERPAVGTLSVNGLSFIYTPQFGDAPDFFRFDVTNGYFNSGPYIYSVQSEPLQAPQPPTAQPQTITIDADTAPNIQLTGIDLNGQSLSYSVFTSSFVTMVSPGVYQLLHGTLRGSGSAYTYYPSYGFTGIDGFDFIVKEPLGLTSATAEVLITVAPEADGYTANRVCDSFLRVFVSLPSRAYPRGERFAGQSAHVLTRLQLDARGGLRGARPVHERWQCRRLYSSRFLFLSSRSLVRRSGYVFVRRERRHRV